jgi:hypothetical protein
VSILDRIVSRHLDDSALARIWSESSTGGGKTQDPHLAECAECRARFAAFENWLYELHDVGVDEANDVFPPEKLASQQAHIMRRLEAAERPARVIAFPRFGRPATVSHGAPQRWIAAAAAAGLIVGLAAGQLLDLRRSLGRSVTVHELDLAQTDARNRNRVPPVSAAMLASDDSILLYDVSTAPSIPELQPLDAITPRMRDTDPLSR